MGIFVSRCFIEIINYVLVWFLPGKDSDLGGGVQAYTIFRPCFKSIIKTRDCKTRYKEALYIQNLKGRQKKI